MGPLCVYVYYFYALQAAQADLKRLLDREVWLDFIDECSRVASPKGKGKAKLASVTWERLLSDASHVALREYHAQKKAKRVCQYLEGGDMC